MSETETEPYPEHEKLRAVKAESQAIGEFLEWLGEEQGLSICRAHEHGEACVDADGDGDGDLTCGWEGGELVPDRVSIETRLARYFDIDRDKLEAEKMVMLEKLRAHAQQTR